MIRKCLHTVFWTNKVGITADRANGMKKTAFIGIRNLVSKDDPTNKQGDKEIKEQRGANRGSYELTALVTYSSCLLNKHVCQLFISDSHLCLYILR